MPIGVNTPWRPQSLPAYSITHEFQEYLATTSPPSSPAGDSNRRGPDLGKAKKNQNPYSPGHDTQIEQAKTRTDDGPRRAPKQAKTRTEQAETRTEQAETRTEQAETRTEQAETRTEQAEDAHRTG